MLNVDLDKLDKLAKNSIQADLFITTFFRSISCSC